ncbi:hypothetical protein [Dongia sp.]|uniref:hypothetical protein n=1 Tax=Dongia sp. TaxID=1977262 RepID=UPI0035B15ADD
MNTPRTRPPVRYSPKISPTKDGLFRTGIANDQFAETIGLIITHWPHIEEKMVVIFADLTGIDDFSSARLIFRSIINQNTRIDIMTAMLEKAPQNRERAIFFDNIIKEFKALNRIRNTYAHGLWYTHEDGETIYLEAETDNYHAFLDKREVPLTELVDVLSRYQSLQGELLDRGRALLMAKALKSSPGNKDERQS